MSLGSFFKKQFIDVIHWTEDADGVLAYRFPMRDFEIQYGAQLTVRESQMAVFVDEGKIADVFGPGRYTLTTQTLPLLTNLKNWDKLFQSPFKSDVYFYSTRLQLNQKWGTPNPITKMPRLVEPDRSLPSWTLAPGSITVPFTANSTSVLTCATPTPART